MKILIVGYYSPETMAWYLERTFLKLGHNVEILCYRSMFSGISPHNLISKGFRHAPILKNLYATKINNNLINKVKKNKYDLVLFLKSEIIYPSTVEIVKTYANKVVNWFMDPIVELHRTINPDLISKFDHFFVKDLFIKKRLNELGFSNVGFLLEGYDPEIFYPTKPQKEYLSDISLVGNIYRYRLQILNSIKDKNLRVWGDLVNVNKHEVRSFYQGKRAITEEKNKIFNSAKIVLNTHTPSEISGCNVRIFEISGAGAFQLSDPTLYTSKLFKNKKEMVFYENVKELKEFIGYYLNSPQERLKIAKAGHENVLKNHTYEKRISELFKLIKLNPQSF